MKLSIAKLKDNTFIKSNLKIIKVTIILMIITTSILIGIAIRKNNQPIIIPLKPGVTEKDDKVVMETSKDCDSLEEQFKNYYDQQNKLYKDKYVNREGVVFNTAPNLDSANVSESKAPNFTQTNIQVKGIDESDIVKTDGSRIFALNINDRKINLVKVYPFSEAKKVSELKLINSTPLEMFLNGDKLIVFSSKYDNQNIEYKIKPSKVRIAPNVSNLVEIRIYNVSNLEDPYLERKVEIQGTFVTSRLKDGYIYLVSNKHVYENQDIIPLYRDNQNGNEFQKTCDCNEVSIIDEDYIYPSLTTITALNINSLTAEPKFENFVGNTQTVYVSKENIYLVSSKSSYYLNNRIDTRSFSERTNINKLSYSKDRINYDTSVEFEGRLLNQFSLDEYENNLRVAGTIGNSESNFLYIFDEDLEQVSYIDNLARGEKIYSARFYGDLAAMVTFRQIDPLFVFDLSDPKSPKLKGELKIPGYSDYLQFIDRNTIIGFGKDADEKTGRFAGLKLAIFDITDMSNPKEISKIQMGDRRSESEALKNHKAFVYDSKNKVIILPALIAKIDKDKCKENTFCYGTPVSQGAQVIKLNESMSLEMIGEISHGVIDGSNYYGSTSAEVKRSIVIENKIIAISNSKISINEIDTLEQIKSIKL